MTQYLKLHGEALVRRGYSVVPIPPGTKGPLSKGWPDIRATEEDVRKWYANGRANDGVGVLARNTPAIDLDIDDAAVIAEMMPLLQRMFPVLPPARIGRAPRLMYICRTDEPFRKINSDKFRHVLLDETYKVEILGDGQQFVAFHIHPDTGKPYTWPGEQLFDIDWASLPVLSRDMAVEIADTFDAIGAARVLTGEWELVEKASPRAHADDAWDGTIPDPLGLDDDTIRGVLAYQNLDVYAEWVQTGQELHHETGGSPRGFDLWYERSRDFPKCTNVEAHQAKWDGFGAYSRRPATFGSTMKRARERGWVRPIPDDFEALPAVAEGEVDLSMFQRNKAGDILATVENVHKALCEPRLTGVEIAYDRFRDELMLTAVGKVEWRAFTDPDYMRLRITLEKGGFKPIGREMIRDAVALVGDENRFDSAELWIGRLTWDGTPRCERFLETYFGVPDSPYARAVSLYLWSGLAGRVLVPGVKADMVPVLVGPQGLGKSEGIAAMVPSEDHFVEVALDAHDDSMARKMRGVLIGEIAELRGLQTREVEAVKAFITRRFEKWVPKFKEFAITYPRRLLFVGTSNPDEILADETGNRRWLPVKVSTVDREGIARDRDLLWAEARELFKDGGVRWRDAQALAEPEHAAFMVNDAWAPAIDMWLDEAEMEHDTPPRARPIRVHDVLVGALRFNTRDILRVHELRVGKILAAMGFVKTVRRVTGKLAKVWVDPRFEDGDLV